MSRWLLGWQEMHCKKKATVAFSRAVLCWVLRGPGRPGARWWDPEAWGEEAEAPAPAGEEGVVALLWNPALLALEWQSRKSREVQRGLTSGPPSQSFMAWLLPTSVRKRSTGAASSGARAGWL